MVTTDGMYAPKLIYAFRVPNFAEAIEEHPIGTYSPRMVLSSLPAGAAHAYIGHSPYPIIGGYMVTTDGMYGPKLIYACRVPNFAEAIEEHPIGTDSPVDVFATPQVDVGRIGDDYDTGKATKSGLSNLVIGRATVAAIEPGKSLNEKPMVLPTDTYELYVEFVVHLPDKGDVYPVERILSHHMSMVDELVSAEQLRTGTAAKTMADMDHNLQIHKAYLRHANQEKLYPERMTGRKLAGLKLEPAEVSERDRGNPPVT
eukprot:gene12239-14452_t